MISRYFKSHSLTTMTFGFKAALLTYVELSRSALCSVTLCDAAKSVNRPLLPLYRPPECMRDMLQEGNDVRTSRSTVSSQ